MNWIFDPLLPLPIIGAIFALLIILRLMVRFHGLISLLSFIIAIFVLAILAINPLKETGEKKALPGIVGIILDETPSILASKKIEEVRQIKSELEKKLGRDFIIKTDTLSKQDAEIDLSQKINSLSGSHNQKQISGVFVISDGRLKIGEIDDIPFPINQIIVGKSNEHDRSIRIKKPAIATDIGKIATIILEIEDNKFANGNAEIELKMGGLTERRNVPINQEFRIDIPIEKSGKQEIAISTPVLEGEISGANNSIITEIEGIFDRLRVLLISGEPYEGLRSWRSLLKSDPSIDMVHFTILRGPDKEDFAAQNEISLIPFPVEELFYEKLSSFDLIIIDRFMAQDVLRDEYLENIANYVEEGGALLSVFGPYDTTKEGILNTKLASILPVSGLPTIENAPFKPEINKNANSHPIVKGLNRDWGQWDSYFKTTSKDEIILNAQSNPLLTVRNHGKGRVAALLSENSWYWARGIDGGGPFRELIGRTVHYLLKDPQFEKNKISLNADFDKLSAIADSTGGNIEIIGPNYSISKPLSEINTEQKFEFDAKEFGLYTAKFGSLFDYAILGTHFEIIGKPLNAIQFPKAAKTRGGIGFTRDPGFSLNFEMIDRLPVFSDNNYKLLRPSLEAPRSGRMPLINRNLLLSIAIIAIFISWLFEGHVFFRGILKNRH